MNGKGKTVYFPQTQPSFKVKSVAVRKECLSLVKQIHFTRDILLFWVT